MQLALYCEPTLALHPVLFLFPERRPFCRCRLPVGARARGGALGYSGPPDVVVGDDLAVLRREARQAGRSSVSLFLSAKMMSLLLNTETELCTHAMHGLFSKNLPKCPCASIVLLRRTSAKMTRPRQRSGPRHLPDLPNSR